MSRKTRKLKSRLVARTLAGAMALSALVAGLSELAAQPAPGASPRIALVIGEAAYKTGPLSSSANDAGLIADTLHLAGFDVTGAADLDQDGLRRSLREFVEKAAAAGPDAVVFVYLSGRAVQYAGENYLAPIEATIPRASNVPLEAVRLSDYLQPLAQMQLKARIVVLDASRINAFAQTGEPLAGGLALVEPDTGSLYAFNAAPDSVAPNETGPYGVYAQALTEMLREGGLPVDAAFARTRLRVSEQTKGALVPWDESKLAPAPVLFARAPGAPPPAVAIETQANMRARPIRDYPVDQAYAATLEQDTLSAYVDFLNAYPNSRLCLAGARHARRAPRGGDLAARLAGQYAERLLDLSATLSARTACRGRAPAPRLDQRRADRAAALRGLRIRRAAAGRGGRDLFPASLCGVRRPGLGRAAADGLSAAASPVSGRARAAAAALRRPAALAADRRAAAIRPARRASGPVPCPRRSADPAARREHLLQLP